MPVLLASILAISGCGDDAKKPPKSQAPPASTTPTTPPSYSTEQVKEALLSPREISPKAREISVAFLELKDNRALICSSSGFKLPGNPELTKRQIISPSKDEDQFQYTQLIARYNDSSNASQAYSSIQKKIKSCPPKKHTPPKKIRENFSLLSHDDTWKTSEDSLNGWTHLRGIEQQAVSASITKFNVYHFRYDYAVRGNLLVTTTYFERREPKKSAEPITKRATELLTKQLQKFG